MAVSFSPFAGAGWQFFTNTGDVLAGGKIYTYAAGTTTPLATYQEVTGVTPHANPIVLDSAGRVSSEIWLTQGSDYKFVLKDSSDATIGTYDNISSYTFASAVLKSSSTGSAILPNGTTGQRDASPTVGYLRYNTTTGKFEGYGASGWGQIGGSGGATGAGDNKIFVQNQRYATSNFTLGQDQQTTATISITSPAVVSQTNTYVGGEEVYFQTTGALPTGLSANTTYYVSTSGLNAGSFQVAATRGGASISVSGTQSGTHTCGPAFSASTVGPLTIGTGVTLTIPSGQRLVVL